ncbi:MAG TPA: helix-turn-helix transcriptional regulator [Paenibacillaceae bacterium]
MEQPLTMDRSRPVWPTGFPAERIRKFFGEKEAIFQQSLPSPFVLVVTDPSGTVLYALEHPAGSRSHVGRIAREGVNLIQKPYRIQPLEMAVRRKNDVCLGGHETWFPGEKGWACAVIALREPKAQEPVRDIFAYMSLFMPERNLRVDTYPYVKALALVLENGLGGCKTCWTDFADFMAFQLEQFDLTPRERQVAALWMMDYDYKQIGRAIGISENTVRVITNRIYLKLNVNSKASLILRVLGAI